MHTGCVVVQFYLGFKFYFPLFQTRYHILSYPKTKENVIQNMQGQNLTTT